MNAYVFRDGDRLETERDLNYHFRLDTAVMVVDREGEELAVGLVEGFDEMVVWVSGQAYSREEYLFHSTPFPQH